MGVYSLKSLKAMAILVPIALTAAFGYLLLFALPQELPTILLYALAVLAVGVGAAMMANYVFSKFSRMQEQMARSLLELSTLSAIAMALGRGSDLRQRMQSALGKVPQLLRSDAAVALLYDGTGELEASIASGMSPEAMAELEKAPLAQEVRQVLSMAEGLAHPSGSAAESSTVGQILSKYSFSSCAFAPVDTGQRTVGLLVVARREAHRFTRQEGESLSAVAHQVAVAVENDRLLLEARRRGEQLGALNEAGMSLTAELSLEAVLQKVVDLARGLAGARYAALAVAPESGGITHFITSGVSQEERERIGRLPEGRGLLGEAMKSHRPIRVGAISQDPRSAGFPPGHPAMSSFLGVPILSKGKVFGTIYLTDKLESPEFTLEDEELLSTLAAQAAIAVENARLYEQVQTIAVLEERERIAREMHDGLAQVLGYVNTKAQAVRELLSTGNLSSAQDNLVQMEKMAREIYADVREAILGLRTSVGPERGLIPTLAEYLHRFSEQSGIKAVLAPGDPRNPPLLSPAAEIQLVRIIQEALTNVRKHAAAKRAWVTLETKDGQLLVTVADDGKGFDLAHITRGDWPQFGLQTMRERTEAVKGEFHVETAPGQGTKVVVMLPLVSREVGVNARSSG